MSIEDVTRREDDWVEVPATLGDGSGYAVEPLQLRPGTGDDEVVLKEVPPIGSQVRITDLRAGLDLIEEER